MWGLLSLVTFICLHTIVAFAHLRTIKENTCVPHRRLVC